MASKIINCLYDDLVNNFNPPESEEWTKVTIKELVPGKTYFLPVYFWAKENRKIIVEFHHPNNGMQSKIKTIVEAADRKNRETWTKKRYKLDSKRHNGSAVIHFGWPEGTTTTPLSVSLGALERSTSKRQRLINNGCCPECGKEGMWVTMAMICKEHGAFIGGL